MKSDIKQGEQIEVVSASGTRYTIWVAEEWADATSVTDDQDRLILTGLSYEIDRNHHPVAMDDGTFRIAETDEILRRV